MQICTMVHVQFHFSHKTSPDRVMITLLDGVTNCEGWQNFPRYEIFDWEI